jgi:Secretion system C-terminal sorting domain
MKRNSTFVCITLFVIAFLLSNFTTAFSQCTAPSMRFENPVLVSGTDGEEDAEYKFSSVTPGVDCFITIKDKVGGATLTSIDDNTYGYSRAWQPVTKMPNALGESYVSFSLIFRDSADGHNHKYNCAQISFIDVDGDNQHVREFVASKDHSLYSVSNVTALGISNDNGMLKAVGPITNFAGLDTAAWITNINFTYTNQHKISEIRVGNIAEPGYTVQDRYSCIYFKQSSMPNIIVLPVRYISFDAVLKNKNVLLKWITNAENSNENFEVQRSFDNIGFASFATVSKGTQTGGEKVFTSTDMAANLTGREMVYYRLKQTDENGKVSYSNSVAVRLQTITGVDMKVAPNPFAEKINVVFNSVQSGNAEISIVSIAGVPVLSRKSVISKGYNNLQVDGVSSLPAGMYMARLIVNGEVIDKQKIMK